VPRRVEPGVTTTSKVSCVHLVAALPAWMVADGEYSGVAVGSTAEFGFAIEPEHVDAGPRSTGLEQVGEAVPTTTVSGAALVTSPDAPVVIDTGDVKPIVVTDAQDGDTVSVRGRLVVEPFLWATDGVLWPLVPDGVRLWRVNRIRIVGASEGDLDEVPPAAEVVHDAVYLLDLSRP
jgi:hypothetical protein